MSIPEKEREGLIISLSFFSKREPRRESEMESHESPSSRSIAARWKKHTIILAQKQGPGNELCALGGSLHLSGPHRRRQNRVGCMGGGPALVPTKARTLMHSVFGGSSSTRALWGAPVNTPAQCLISLGPKEVPPQSQKTPP